MVVISKPFSPHRLARYGLARYGLARCSSALVLGWSIGWLGTIGGSIAIAPVWAQVPGSPALPQLPACQPPRVDEFLLLVPNPQTDTQARLQQLLPANAVLTPCNYLNTAVVRVEGFASAEIASAWAQYLSEMASVQAFVARPAPPSSIATAPVPNAVGGTSTPVAATTPVYRPQSLAAGYAVVVDYFDKPEMASSLRQVINREVGLVSFEQQPYLLAIVTPDPAAASTLLKTLSERGFSAAIVDSRRAVLLTSAVQVN